MAAMPGRPALRAGTSAPGSINGAQLRYFVTIDQHMVAALGFGAAAWQTAPRDQFIGWSHEQRQNNLALLVNNARFLIMPWVKSKNS